MNWNISRNRKKILKNDAKISEYFHIHTRYFLRYYTINVRYYATVVAFSVSLSMSQAFIAGAASKAGDADSSRVPGLTSGLQGSMNVHLLVPQ